MGTLLPVHGFVLAGGKSSRMGRDKALLEFRGRPMVEIAVEKLRGFCAEVSIVGEREDLAGFAVVVQGEREEAGPAAGFEAGLKACEREWGLFVPVDVPLVPADWLQGWCERAMAAGGGYVRCAGEDHAAIAVLHREMLAGWSAAMEGGERKLTRLLEAAGAGAVEVGAEDAGLLRNVNTAEELAAAEADGARGGRY